MAEPTEKPEDAKVMYLKECYCNCGVDHHRDISVHESAPLESAEEFGRRLAMLGNLEMGQRRDVVRIEARDAAVRADERSRWVSKLEREAEFQDDPAMPAWLSATLRLWARRLRENAE